MQVSNPVSTNQQFNQEDNMRKTIIGLAIVSLLGSAGAS
jgi:hypothetical protein